MNPIVWVDLLGLDKFIGWRVQRHRGWWSDYRWTKAICQKCNGKYREEFVLYEQWRPMNINTLSVPGQPGNVGAVNAAFDIYEAMKHAQEYGSLSKMEILLDQPQEYGQMICDSAGE